MNKSSLGIVLCIYGCSCAAAADGPSVETFKQLMEKRLLKLLPEGFTERNVLFETVRAGAPNAGFYPFQATLTIRDYGPGYPANRYYGETCTGHMDQWKFDVSRDRFGEWAVEGPMTVTLSDGHKCKPNLSAGVSSIPVASLPGSPAGKGPIASAGPMSPEANSSGLPTGQWGCNGTGNRMLFSFYLQPNGTYLDGFKKQDGTYRYDARSGTITFSGGFMGGQLGRNVRGRDFTLSGTVNCQAVL